MKTVTLILICFEIRVLNNYLNIGCVNVYYLVFMSELYKLQHL